MEQAKFNGITCNFYVDASGEMFMTRKQIAEALGYNSESAIREMQNDEEKIDNFKGKVTTHYIAKLEGNLKVSRGEANMEIKEMSRRKVIRFLVQSISLITLSINNLKRR